MISVIIPIYRGIKYISKQVQQEEDAAKHTDEEIELIFVNDDPDIHLPESIVSRSRIRIIQTKINTGIQAARIRGLSVAEGEYIHFLDQDDEIDPNYYTSQLAHIGDADAVYCRCYNGKRQTYRYDRIFEGAFEKNNILERCPVISPGQLLIRKKSISKFWIENILRNMGSDDYLLWLCMCAENRKFAENREILFTHVKNGDNYSSDILRARKSDEEMADLLIKSKKFSDEESSRLRALPEKLQKRRYETQRKDQIVLYVLSELLHCCEKKNMLEDFFLRRGIKKVAIYGAAIMGERIKGVLHGTEVQVSCFLDRNAPFIDEDIPVYKWGEDKHDFEAVIISLIANEDKIADELKKREGIRAFMIREIVRELTDE